MFHISAWELLRSEIIYEVFPEIVDAVGALPS